MSIFEYDKEEEERKLRKAEYEAGVADGFNDGINTAKKRYRSFAHCQKLLV